MEKLIDKIVDILDESTYEEINELVKDIKAYSKEREKEAKDDLIENAMASIKEGDEVCAKYKDTEIVGTVKRVGDKSFSIKAEIDGLIKTVSRSYHLYLGHSNEKNIRKTA